MTEKEKWEAIFIEDCEQGLKEIKMTEELEKEAQENCVCTDTYMRANYVTGYIAGAEPREKRIEELETQIETKDIQIKELQEQNYYWKESSFDWRHKFFKLDKVKRLIEKDKRIKELEKEIKLLGERCNQLLADKGKLTDENAELKDDKKVMADNYSKMEQKFYTRLSKAKEIIKKYLSIGVGGKITQNYLDVTKEAEQFLRESK
jgi:ElaB/YqjD/DUF883 family membrane-anchored ribosome-binding protein